jgi:toxin ParE1/3/4
MVAPNFELTQAAEKDLVEIGLFTRERWGAAQCRRYLTQLDRSFRALGDNPRRGKPAEVEGYFRYRVGKHLIFYEVDVNGGVLIVRVLHVRMLPTRHLG